jgi:phosphoglycolate phosphatase
MSPDVANVALRYDAVFYDLDGTLVDSRPGIEASLRAALATHAPGVEPPALDTLLGRPLAGLLSEALPGLEPAALPAVAAAFAQHYDAQGWRLSRPYPGVIAALQQLAAAGVRQIVVTNKRRHPALAILAAFEVAPCLEALYTLDSVQPPYRDKAAMARAACAACAVRGARLLVVGDSVDDRQMADACDASFAAATYGYGRAVTAAGDRRTAPHVATLPADLVLDSPAGIVALVMAADGCGSDA